PTILFSNIDEKDISSEKIWWQNDQVFDWKLSYDEWLNDQCIVSNELALIEATDLSDNKWVVLESHSSFKEPKPIGEIPWVKPNKEVWYQVRSYLVKDYQYNDMK